MSKAAWYDILDLAEAYGWNPLGTVPDEWYSHALDLHGDSFDEQDRWYTNSDGARLVLLEDALNLADALERAFLADEPPGSSYSPENTPPGRADPLSRLQPGIGAISAVLDFCRLGAFWIERHSQN